MISRLFFRFRAWLILFIFFTLSISVPYSPAPEEGVNILPSDVAGISMNTEEEVFPQISCLLEIILQESFGLYNLFPSEDWPSDGLMVAPVANFDIISESSFTVKFYPPRVRRLLAVDTPLPDERYGETPPRPPEMKQ